MADFGTAAQQSALLPGLIESASFAPGSLALVEPRFDSDPFRPKTSARRDGGD